MSEESDELYVSIIHHKTESTERGRIRRTIISQLNHIGSSGAVAFTTRVLARALVSPVEHEWVEDKKGEYGVAFATRFISQVLASVKPKLDRVPADSEEV